VSVFEGVCMCVYVCVHAHPSVFICLYVTFLLQCVYMLMSHCLLLSCYAHKSYLGLARTVHVH